MWGPYALATLRRNFRQGSAYVTYSHTVQQNVFIGQTLSVDQLSAGLRRPARRPRQGPRHVGRLVRARRDPVSTGQAGVPNTQYTFVQGEAALTWIARTRCATGRFTRLQQMGGSEIGQAPTFNYNAITLEASVMLPEPRTPMVLLLL